MDHWNDCGINVLPPISINELKPRLADLDRESIFEIYLEITEYLALRFEMPPIDIAADMLDMFSERCEEA